MIRYDKREISIEKLAKYSIEDFLERTISDLVFDRGDFLIENDELDFLKLTKKEIKDVTKIINKRLSVLLKISKVL